MIRNYSKERNPYVVFMDGDQWEVVSFVSDPMGMSIATNISTREAAQRTADQFWMFDRMEETERIQPVNHIIRLVRDGYVDEIWCEPEIWNDQDTINISRAMEIAEEGEFTEESIQKGKAFLEKRYGKDIPEDERWSAREKRELEAAAEAKEKNPPFIYLDTSTQLHKPYIVYGGETTHIMDSFETRRDAETYIVFLKGKNRPGKKEYDTSL